MSADRSFARFSTFSKPPRTDHIPDGGMCLSAFVILSPGGRNNHVLMGRLNPDAPWGLMGALDRERAERCSEGWMLPSSHLVLLESPQEAAARILGEQLSIPGQKLDGPFTFSEVYGPRNHWDFHFVFTGERDEVPTSDAWSELRFVDLDTVKKEEIARSHEDVLALVGRWKPR